MFYEMLTGKAAFGGETVTDTLASVIRSEPDWSLLPPSTPPAIRKLPQRCLKKDVKQRLQAIGDARIVIEDVISGADTDAVVPLPSPPRPIWRRLLPWAVAFATCALLTGAVLLTFAFRSPHSVAMHFRAVTNFSGVQSYPTLSTDGRSVAFVSNKDGHYNIYVGLINGGNVVQLTDDPNLKTRPCWSPDGTEIAYARLNDSGIWDIWKVPALGGVPRRFILNAADPTWSRDGRSFAYRNSVTGAIWISDSFGQNGHELASTRRPGWGRGNSTTGFLNSAPRFSPDGREIAFATSWGGPYGELEVVNLDSDKLRQLTHDNALVLSPAWSAEGRFIYFASSRGGTLNIWKIAEDGSQLEQITSGQGDDAQLDISADGKRIVFSSFRANVNIVQLDLDAAGQQSAKLLIADAARDQFGPAYSPDGKHLAYFSNLKGVEKEGIWLANPDGSNPVPLVQDQRINIFPCWTPDSGYLVYASYASSSLSGSLASEYRRISISGGAPQALLNSAPDNSSDVGSDGRLLFQGPHGQVEISATPNTQTLTTLPSDENTFLFRWSPDENSIAYIVQPVQEDDPHAGLWVYGLNKTPRQIFRGWITWYTRGPKNEIYLIQGKADLKGVLWKLDWSGHGLTRVPVSIPVPFHYWFDSPFTQFDISPDGRHLAFNTQEVLQANIGMLENIR